MALSAEELPNTNAVVTLGLAAQRLENKDAFGKSDPFLKISKARESGAWVPVLKSEVGLDWGLGGSAFLNFQRWGVHACPACLRCNPVSTSLPLKGPGSPCCQTQVVSNDLNPTWRPLRVSMASLCHCDDARPLLIEARASPGGDCL